MYNKCCPCNAIVFKRQSNILNFISAHCHIGSLIFQSVAVKFEIAKFKPCKIYAWMNFIIVALFAFSVCSRSFNFSTYIVFSAFTRASCVAIRLSNKSIALIWISILLKIYFCSINFVNRRKI